MEGAGGVDDVFDQKVEAAFGFAEGAVIVGLARDVHNLGKGETASICQALLQGHAFQKLDEDVGCAVGGPPSVKHIDDVGMLDGTGRTRFVEEPANQLCIPCQLGVQDLDGGTAVDERILDQVHLPKAALTEQPNHTVISKELADFHYHVRVERDVAPVRVGDKIISGLVSA